MKVTPIKTVRFSTFNIVLCTILLFLNSCQENDMAKVKSMFNEQDADVELADSVKFIYKEGAYIRAVVTGKTIKRYTKTQNKLEFPDGLLVKFFDQLNLISVLKANYAENNDAEQIIKVSGDVHMENARAEVLETQELTWNVRNKKIFTDKPIKIKTPDNIIYGVGFDSDEDFSNYTIRKVNGIVVVDDAQGFK
jgi:LPS export ABC transporter protein LptC